MSKGGSVVKLITYQKDGKNCSKNMPGAVKVESKNWYILYYGRDSKQRRECAHSEDRKVAEKLLARRIVEAEDGETPAQDLKSLRYEGIRNNYLKAKPEQASYPGLKHLDAYFTGERLSAIRPAMLRDFIEQRREEDEAADPTIRRNLVMLRAMFNQAVADEMIGANDVPPFMMPKDSDAAGTYITPEQFEDIRKHLPENLNLFYDFMYATGCRLGALREITWSMVNEDCSLINLPGSITKSGKAILIPVPETVAKELRKKFRVEKEKVFEYTNYRPEWAKAVAKAKLGTWDQKTRTRTGVRIHDCRCSAAINLLAAGVDEGTVLKIGGWATRKMLDRYNVQHSEIVKAAMKKRDAYIAERKASAR